MLPDLKEQVKEILASTGEPALCPPKQTLVDSLQANGVDVPYLATLLTDLLQNARQNVKRQVILDVLALLGADIRESKAQVPSIIVQVVGDETKISQIYTPERIL